MAWTIVNETRPMPETLRDAPLNEVYETEAGDSVWRTSTGCGLRLFEGGEIDVINVKHDLIHLVKHLGPAPKIRWDE